MDAFVFMNSVESGSIASGGKHNQDSPYHVDDGGFDDDSGTADENKVTLADFDGKIKQGYNLNDVYALEYDFGSGHKEILRIGYADSVDVGGAIAGGARRAVSAGYRQPRLSGGAHCDKDSSSNTLLYIALAVAVAGCGYMLYKQNQKEGGGGGGAGFRRLA